MQSIHSLWELVNVESTGCCSDFKDAWDGRPTIHSLARSRLSLISSVKPPPGAIGMTNCRIKQVDTWIAAGGSSGSVACGIAGKELRGERRTPFSINDDNTRVHGATAGFSRFPFAERVRSPWRPLGTTFSSAKYIRQYERPNRGDAGVFGEASPKSVCQGAGVHVSVRSFDHWSGRRHRVRSISMDSGGLLPCERAPTDCTRQWPHDNRRRTMHKPYQTGGAAGGGRIAEKT